MSAPTILIIDDDPVFRSLLAKMLRVRGIEVFEAADGPSAVRIFETGKVAFSVIVSDIQMPEMSGIEVLKRIRVTSQIPFVFFTGLSAVEESQQAYALGADEFITKPVDKEGIQKIVGLFNKENQERAEKAAHRELGPDDFREIRIEEFLSTSTLQSDVYIRLSQKRFIKIAKKGEVSPRERIADYRAKKIENLYVLAADFSLYITFAAELSAKVVDSPSIAREARLQILQTSTKLMVEHCFLANEIEKKDLDSAQKVVESALKFASDHPAIMEQLVYLNTHANRLYAHSVSVALYSALLARSFGWDSETTLTRIALGGLFHDIGKREIAADLLYKSRKELTREELAIMESHCARGRDLLMTVKGLPEEVALIAMNHHENRSGTGYPRRLRNDQTTAHVRLVHLIDKFCSLTNPISPADLPLTHHEALARIVTHYESEVDPQFLQLLMNLCKYDPTAASGSQNRAS